MLQIRELRLLEVKLTEVVQLAYGKQDPDLVCQIPRPMYDPLCYASYHQKTYLPPWPAWFSRLGVILCTEVLPGSVSGQVRAHA